MKLVFKSFQANHIFIVYRPFLVILKGKRECSELMCRCPYPGTNTGTSMSKK